MEIPETRKGLILSNEHLVANFVFVRILTFISTYFEQNTYDRYAKSKNTYVFGAEIRTEIRTQYVRIQTIRTRTYSYVFGTYSVRIRTYSYVFSKNTYEYVRIRTEYVRNTYEYACVRIVYVLI